MTRHGADRITAAFEDFHNLIAPHTLGYDRVFGHMLSNLNTYDSFPPYNFETLDNDQYRVTFALAGYDKDNIEIVLQENQLYIKGSTNYFEFNETSTEKRTYIHQGIAGRGFERRIELANDINVLTAEMKNGLLTIDLQRVIPEEKKAKTIKIK